ncbi:hypothetical protein WN51_03674 [Melipona quadrifasciata]|uniref:Uncharacterized protein n=1 Tax=Melipona quadrifasciata TaxID=166423 RepID=A0A0M8ZV37_9HYME|nr:hypothetical protein WN51_03674 [Melipona quadrifasciata]
MDNALTQIKLIVQTTTAIYQECAIISQTPRSLKSIYKHIQTRMEYLQINESTDYNTVINVSSTWKFGQNFNKRQVTLKSDRRSQSHRPNQAVFNLMMDDYLPENLMRRLLWRSISSESRSPINNSESITIKTVVIPVDHRKLKRCPKFEYEDRLKSVFQSDYDGNCTYTRVCTTNDSKQKNNGEDKNEPVNRQDNETFNEILKEIVSENLTKKVEESGKDRRTKSVLVAGHILVTMLLISAIAALVEVLRIRFAKDKVLQRKPH